MKKAALLGMLVIFLAIATTAYAHPPRDIKITFDSGTKVVTAVIMHDVANPLNHYIEKVDVELNGNEIIAHNISRQDNNDSQTVSYLIPDVKDGDEISVEGHCSISGSLRKKITAGR